jgi:ArsR family transcriptional regulator
MTAKRAAAKLSEEQFQAIGHAVADPRRFAILQQIASAADHLSCSALDQHQVISAATISHHIKELSEAGLIRVERDGRNANLFFCRTVWQNYLKRLASI